MLEVFADAKSDHAIVLGKRHTQVTRVSDIKVLPNVEIEDDTIEDLDYAQGVCDRPRSNSWLIARSAADCISSVAMIA